MKITLNERATYSTVALRDIPMGRIAQNKSSAIFYFKLESGSVIGLPDGSFPFQVSASFTDRTATLLPEYFSITLGGV